MTIYGFKLRFSKLLAGLLLSLNLIPGPAAAAVPDNSGEFFKQIRLLAADFDSEIMAIEAASKASDPDLKTAAEARFNITATKLGSVFSQSKNPEDAMAILLLYSNNALAAGRLTDLVALYDNLKGKQLADLESDPRFYSFIANVVWALGSAVDSKSASDTAMIYIKSFKAMGPAKALLISTLGRLAVERGEIDVGLQLFSTAVLLAPKIEANAISHYWLGLAAQSRADISAALEHFETTKQITAGSKERWALELNRRIEIALSLDSPHSDTPPADPEQAYVYSQFQLLETFKPRR